MPSRREFLKTAGGAGLGVAALGPTAVDATAGAPAVHIQEVVPVAVGSANGIESVGLALEQVADGVDTLEAVVAGVNLVEEDPNDTSVGYGGLPNLDGVVQLDSEELVDAEDVEQAAREAEIRDQTRKFWIGVAFGLPLFLFSMGRDFNLLGAWANGTWAV